MLYPIQQRQNESNSELQHRKQVMLPAVFIIKRSITYCWPEDRSGKTNNLGTSGYPWESAAEGREGPWPLPGFSYMV